MTASENRGERGNAGLASEGAAGNWNAISPACTAMALPSYRATGSRNKFLETPV